MHSTYERVLEKLTTKDKKRKGLCRLDELDIRQGIDLRAELRRIEIELIKRALEITKGNQKEAAQLLGLKHTTLHRKVKHFDLR